MVPQLPLAVPQPIARGEPGFGYPFRWAVYRWLDGETFATDRVRDAVEAAQDLAHFVRALRSVDPAGAPPSRRVTPLRLRDEQARATIESLRDAFDADALTRAWDGSLRAGEWAGGAVWTHGDLQPPNLLVEGGRLRAVIDFGSVGGGDPAVDVIPAWNVFTGSARDAYRAALDVDDDAWLRARGFALYQALMIIPYYPATNPAFVALAVRTVEQILAAPT